MKKGLLGLLVIALTVVGCQNYDDQFDDLNKKISNLATTVGGLETVQTAITTLGSKLDALSSSALTDSDLAQVLTEVANVKAAVAEIRATDVSGIEAEVADLDTEVAQILEKLGDLLSQNAVIPGNLVIANLGDLAAAQELIKTKADDPLVTIQGNVHISITANNGLKDSIAALNAITAKLKIVQSTATITTVSGGAVALPELMYINGSYAASGAGGVSAPKLRTINGGAAIDTGGAVSYPLLSSVGTTVMISQTSTVTSVDFSGLSSGAVLTGATSLTLPNATSVKVGGVLPAIVHLAKATEFVSSYSGAAQTASTITVGGAAATFSLASTKFTGQVTLTTTGDANLSGVTEAGALHVDAASINLSGVTKLTAATTLSATTVNISALKSNTDTVTLVGPTTVSLPALTALGGDFVAASATSFSAPLLATSTGTIDLKAAATVEVLSLTAATDLADAATITALTISGQVATVDVTSFVKMATLNYTGKLDSSPNPGGQAQALNITSALASLTTLSIGSGGGIGTLTVSASTLKKLTTAGVIINTVVHNNTALEEFDFGHTHLNGDNATVVDITGNTNKNLTSIDLSSVSKVKHVNITGNTSLTTITAPSASVLAEPLATVTVTISGNDTVGTYTDAVAGSETTPFAPTTATAAVVTAFKPFISAYLAQTRTASVTFSINVDKVDDDADGAYDDGNMQTIMAADAAGIAGPDATGGNADDITNGTGGVDTAKELALF